MAPSKLRREGEVEFIDIRREKREQSLLQATLEGLDTRSRDARSLPTLLLYDEQGLKLFEQITFLEEYYLTNAEIAVLESSANNIVERITEGTRLVEFGSGNLRKVEILLKAFENAGKQVDYYALDLSLPELKRTFSQVSTNHYAYVCFHALHGTYDDGIAWLNEPQNQDKSTCVMTLGSSLGNFSRDDAAAFLASIAAVLLPGDSILVGLDACQNPDRVFRAYNDSKGITENFYRNGLEHANRLFGKKVFAQEDWKIEGRYNEELGRHEASYRAIRDVSAGELAFHESDELYLESAYKYTSKQSDSLWRSAGLISQMRYGRSEYRMSYFLRRPTIEPKLMAEADVHLVTPSRIGFDASPSPSQYAEKPLPSEKDWQQLWTAWDTVTRAMLPSTDELLTKPIKLRNDLIFYLGHIPAFADIHFTRATGSPPTPPAFYHSIFERGVDPDVDNPEICHDHSEIPDTWPPLEEMLNYQARVRTRFIEVIKSGEASTDRKLTRSVWLCFEHEAMHLETFLYMLLQSEQVLPPPGHAVPDFKSMALEASERRSLSKWHHIPEEEILVGLDDPENDDGPDRFFGWDNERPSRKIHVGPFEAQNRPISNGEYARYLEETGFEMLPSSWITGGENGDCVDGVLRERTNEAFEGGKSLVASNSFTAGKRIRTVFGLVPLEYALDWPIMASYDELASFAKWAGGRIPSYEEAKSLHHYAEMRKADAVNVNSSLISAVNGHLVNNGVEESPPQSGNRHASCFAKAAGATTGTIPKARARNGSPVPNPDDLFIDLTGANIGFSHWHPTPVTGHSDLRGQADMGGLWEWTSTAISPHPEFKAMDLYPGYTADFFDGKHNIILGGSWATVPRIAGRKSFINWYQRNYPYTWATARLVRDI